MLQVAVGRLERQSAAVRLTTLPVMRSPSASWTSSAAAGAEEQAKEEDDREQELAVISRVDYGRESRADAKPGRLDWLASAVVRLGFVAGGNNSVVECDLAKVEVAGSNPVSRSSLRSLAGSIGSASQSRRPSTSQPREVA